MRNFFNYLIGLVIIAIGIVLILENLNVLSFDLYSAWLYFYPALFVIFGFKFIIDRLRRKGGSWIVGTFLVLFGTLLLLGRFNVVAFEFSDIYKLWPVIIVFIGFAIIGSLRRKNKVIYTKYKKVNGKKGNNEKEDGQSEKKEADKRDRKWTYHEKDDVENKRSSVYSVGDYEYNEENWQVEPLDLKNMIGNFYFDFTKAYIPEEETPIRLNVQAGDIHILIPESIPYRVNAAVIAGEINIDNQTTAGGINRSLQVESEGYDEAVRKLDFHLKLTTGSIRVDRV